LREISGEKRLVPLRILYVASDPLKYPRIKKIAYSLKKFRDVKFDVLIPKIRLIWKKSIINRLLAAVVNYTLLLLQIFFSDADIHWIANSPDFIIFPLALRRKKYILEYRSPWSPQLEIEFGKGPWIYLASFFENFALKNAWIITLTTSRLLERVKRFGKPVFIIPNYPLKNFGKNVIPRDKFREKLGLSSEDKIILFIGKLTHVEGADLLPKIIHEVLKRTDAVFWIVGDGPLYSHLKDIAEKIPGRVQLFGWKPHKEIPNFIEAADICLVPRRETYFSRFYNEEGVTKISEYMFFEKPIIACGISNSKEYLLVREREMADGILRALNGKVKPSRRKTWEEISEKKIFGMIKLIILGKI